MIKCLLCQLELVSNKSYPGHLTAKHDMNTKTYYDMFFRKENEGICPICGKETRFINISKGYKQFCSLKCATPHIQEKCKETLQNKYGVTNFGQTEEAKQKAKQTMNNRYGVDYFCTTTKCLDAGHSEKAKQKQQSTYLKRYGVTSGFNMKACREACQSEEAKLKRKQTNLDRYGTEYTMNKNNHTEEANNKRKATNLERYGVEYNILIPEVLENTIKIIHSEENLQKAHNTKKKNGWNNTKIEPYFKSKLDELNLLYMYNYKSDRYPWKVDFYIEKLDLFIELNCYWTHQFHFYDTNSNQDIEQLKSLIEKAKEKNIYGSVIKTWTDRDIAKRDWAIEHSLNYVVVWNMDQVNMLLEDLKNNNIFIGFIDYNKRV